MPLSTAERQAKRRAKLKTEGKVFFQAWVTQAHAERLSAVVPHKPTTTYCAFLARRKLRKLDPVAE